MYKEMTQDERVAHWLRTHGEIEPITAWSQLGIYRLSAVILRLRQEGMNIKTDKKDVLNRFGEACKFANYILKDAE